MEAMVQKWGYNFGIRIQNLIAKEFPLKSGSIVNIHDNGGEKGNRVHHQGSTGKKGRDHRQN